MKKKNENNTSSWAKFKWKLKNVSGYKELIKLLCYIFFFFLLIMLMNLTMVNKNKIDKKTTTTKTTTTIEKKLSYNELLNNLNNYSKTIKLNITNDKEYVINYKKTDQFYEGYFENEDGTKHFKIDDEDIYEVKGNNNILSNDLFLNLKIEYIVINKLVDILKNNKFIKQDDNDYIYYKYYLEDKTMLVRIQNNVIEYIEIMEDNSTYTYYFE